MQQEMTEILIECRLREMLIEDAINSPFPSFCTQQDWEIEVHYGPFYSAADWFGASSDRDRQRFRRTLVKLMEMGYVQATVSPDTGRVRHIALTPEGRAASDAIGEPVP